MSIGEKRKLDDFIAQLHERWKPERMKRRLRFMKNEQAQKKWTKLYKKFVTKKQAQHSRNVKLLVNFCKRIVKKQKRYEAKLLKAPSAGTKVKGRAGSTRHGFVISYSHYHAPRLNVEEVIHRNNLLKVNENKCFWCKCAPKEDLDHAHPACSTRTSSYAWTNALNIFPSCKQCNSTKGGTALSQWLAYMQKTDT